MTRSPGGEVPATDPQQETGLREHPVIVALRVAFSGDEYEENAEAAAGEAEWSWWKWLAVTTAERALAALPAPAAPQPETACPCPPNNTGAHLIGCARGQYPAPQPETVMNDERARILVGLPMARALAEADREAGQYARVNPDALLALIDDYERLAAPQEPAAPTDGGGKA